MTITLGAIAARLTLLAGLVLGAFAATRHVTGRPIDAFTSAACVAHLPGTAARCQSDRFLAQTGPFIGPAIVGAVAGLVLAIVVMAIVSAVLRFVARPRRLASR